MKQIMRLFLPVAIILFLPTLCLVLASDPASAGLNQWTGNGPGDYQTAALAIDPSTPATLYAGTGSGVFAWTSGGEVQK